MAWLRKGAAGLLKVAKMPLPSTSIGEEEMPNDASGSVKPNAVREVSAERRRPLVEDDERSISVLYWSCTLEYRDLKFKAVSQDVWMGIAYTGCHVLRIFMFFLQAYD